MDAIERMAIERECERLVTRYCHIIDHGEASRVAELFSKDGAWRAPGVVMQGNEEIRVGFTAREANRARMSRHVCNNLLIDVVDENNATGVVYLTLYRHDGDEERRVSPLDGAEMVGEYRDRFERTADGWRMAERSTHVSFVRENVAKKAG
ncbi:MAG: nuclear transport factor 2 family protein [Myxococcota bacterium]